MRSRRRWWTAGTVAVFAIVGLAAVPASAGPARPWAPPRHAAPIRVVPEILGGAIGCGDGGHAYLRTRRVVETRPGVWQALPGGTTVLIEGWFDGGWKPATSLAVTDTGVLVKEGLYRWRSVIHDHGTTTVGPDFYLTGDLCSPAVNDIARQAGVA